MRNIDLANAFLGNMSAEALEADVLRFYAITRALEIISEASRRLGAEIKDRHPEISWLEIADAGNVYRHGYDIVAGKRVWETVKTSLPALRMAIEPEI